VLSAAILSSLDTTQDPCEDFYKYASEFFPASQPLVYSAHAYNAAGGWRRAHPLPSDKGDFSNFNLLFQENQQIVKDILETNGSISIASLEESADRQLLTKLRNLYYSCMDEDTLDQLGEGPLKDFVARVKKLYRGESTDITDPEDDDKRRKGLTSALAFLHSRGLINICEN
jgi:endothelin-converting enzyme